MAALEIQLDLFEEQTEELFLKKEVNSIFISLHKLRKAYWAEKNQFDIKLSRQQEEIEGLKRSFAILLSNK